MRKIIFGLLIASFAMISIVSQSASAQAKGYAGGFLGMSVPDADDSTSRPMFGILGGARLDGEFGLGGYYLSSNKKESVNSVDVDFNYNLYGLEGSYHFEGVADGAYLALRMGISKVKAGTVSYSPMNYGLYFGYDHMFKENFSLGVEAGFSHVDKATKSGNTLDGFGMLNFAATGKFWF